MSSFFTVSFHIMRIYNDSFIYVYVCEDKMFETLTPNGSNIKLYRVAWNRINRFASDT